MSGTGKLVSSRSDDLCFTANWYRSTNPENGPPSRQHRSGSKQPQWNTVDREESHVAQGVRGGASPQYRGAEIPPRWDSVPSSGLSQLTLSKSSVARGPGYARSQTSDRDSAYGSGYGSQAGSSRRPSMSGDSQLPDRLSSRNPRADRTASSLGPSHTEALRQIDHLVLDRLDEPVRRAFRAQLSRKPAVIRLVYQRLTLISRQPQLGTDEAELFRDVPTAWLLSTLADATNKVLSEQPRSQAPFVTPPRLESPSSRLQMLEYEEEDESEAEEADNQDDDDDEDEDEDDE